MTTISLEEQIKAVGREIGMRKNVYPKFVKSGRMTQEKADQEIAVMGAVYETLKRLNTPVVDNFAAGVVAEAQFQRSKWGDAHDRSKSAENWFWLVGYLAGKALRSAITGDPDKAKHHCISSAAALANWHEAIGKDLSECGAGNDHDLRKLEGLPEQIKAIEQRVT